MAAPVVTIVGAGLAGTECAWQLAERGVSVRLFEQKPAKRTAAQTSDGFAELVCSNSFRGEALHNAVGLLKHEMARAGSLVMQVGESTRVPAGGAFAVDRDKFSAAMTAHMHDHPLIEVVHEEVVAIPDERPCVLATGPLTGDALAQDIAATVGEEHLAYYDAIAPIVTADSIDWTRVFKASRYDKGGDAAYVNCPMNEAQYEAFVAAVLEADQVTPREFEKARYFEGCLPVEVMASRGLKTLAHGCMKPVGLVDPNTGEQPFAVVQLRAENDPPTAYNLVGFQTRMRWPDQKKVFRMIPGLEQAEFERLGSVHRNTFVHAPAVLADDLSLKSAPGVYLAGQVAGVEGYVESAACGLLLGVELAARAQGKAPHLPPHTTALGALRNYLRTPRDDFQPSNVLWSMFPSIPGKRMRKRARRDKQVERATEDFGQWFDEIDSIEVRSTGAEQRRA